jgi:uncharacterized protein YhbP (UPF0306 family)
MLARPIQKIMSEQQQKILDFIKTQMLGVVSTVDVANNKPESAMVAFSETDELEIIFGTFDDTRKYGNLQKNPSVAFVISAVPITVQYEGVVQEMQGDDLKKYRQIHIAKNPSSAKYVDHDQQKFFKITPTWIRYTNFGAKPHEIFEIIF